MTNLIDLITQQVTPAVLSQLATMTGENKNQLEGAVAAIVPTLVGGALTKSATPVGAQALLDAIGSQGSLDNIGSLLRGGDGMRNLLTQGGGIVSSLFGADANRTANTISTVTSIHGSSASILLYALAPLSLAVIGQTLGPDALNPTALTTLLADQRQAVQAALPQGLETVVDSSAPALAPVPVAAKIEPAPVASAAKAAAPPAPKPVAAAAVPPPPPPPARSIWRWLGLFLILLLLGALLWWFLLRPQAGTAPPAAATPAPAAADTPAAAAAPLTETTPVTGSTDITATGSVTPATTDTVAATTPVTSTTDITATGSVTPTTTDTTTGTATTPVTSTTDITATGSVTPATTDTTTVTATTPVTSTTDITATGSVTTTTAAEAGNAAVCTALAQLDLVFGASPAITANTPVTDVRRFAGRADLVVAEVATTAQGVAGLDLGAANTAVQELTTAVDGLTGDTVGAAADPSLRRWTTSVTPTQR